MGQRGPKPVPTEMLKRRGSVLVPRRVGEPTPTTGVPPCPSWVSHDARRHWKDLSTLLDGMKILTVADRVALGLLVDAMARYISAKQAVYGTKKIAGTGVTTFNAAGNPMKHPMAVLMQEAWKDVLQACREFGLTPSSRTGVRMIPLPGGRESDDGRQEKARFFRLRS